MGDSMINGVGIRKHILAMATRCRPLREEAVRRRAEDMYDIKIYLMTQSHSVLVESENVLISIVRSSPKPLFPYCCCSAITQRPER